MKGLKERTYAETNKFVWGNNNVQIGSGAGSIRIRYSNLQILGSGSERNVNGIGALLL